MNYGELSRLTENDKKDLKRLYQLAWSGALKKINGTPIKFVRPFHTFAVDPEGAFALKDMPTVVKQVSTEDYIKEFSLE